MPEFLPWFLHSIHTLFTDWERASNGAILNTQYGICHCEPLHLPSHFVAKKTDKHHNGFSKLKGYRKSLKAFIPSVLLSVCLTGRDLDLNNYFWCVLLVKDTNAEIKNAFKRF